MRVHIVIPEELISEVDELVGARRRSQFFEDAVREKLKHMKLLTAAESAAGSLADVDTPGWESSEAAAAWVDAVRRADNQRFD